MEELISVVVPIYNTDIKYLDFCLSSLQRQDYKNLEILCIDGGSTNNVLSVINKYLGDKRFILLTTYANVSHQRNVGINNSKGKYISFVDSDDYIEPNFFTLLYQSMKETNCDIIIPLTYRCIYRKQNLLSKEPYDIHSVEELVTQNNYFEYARPCELVELRKLYKTSLIKNIRFNEKCSYGEDLIFNYELALNSYRTCFVKNAFYYYRVIKGSNSATRRLDKRGLYIIKYLAFTIKKNKRYLSESSLKGIYSEFDRVFNAFYYSLAIHKRIMHLLWMVRFKGIYLKRHHNIHDIIYLLFPITIVNRRNRNAKKHLTD